MSADLESFFRLLVELDEGTETHTKDLAERLGDDTTPRSLTHYVGRAADRRWLERIGYCRRVRWRVVVDEPELPPFDELREEIAGPGKGSQECGLCGAEGISLADHLPDCDAAGAALEEGGA